MKDVTALRARGDRELHRLGDRRDAQVGAQRELREGDENLRVEIFAVTLEAWIVSHLEQHVHVAAPTAARSGVTHPAQRHVLPRGDAGRNLHLDVLVAAHAAFALADLAWAL